MNMYKNCIKYYRNIYVFRTCTTACERLINQDTLSYIIKMLYCIAGEVCRWKLCNFNHNGRFCSINDIFLLKSSLALLVEEHFTVLLTEWWICQFRLVQNLRAVSTSQCHMDSQHRLVDSICLQRQRVVAVYCDPKHITHFHTKFHPRAQSNHMCKCSDRAPHHSCSR